MASNDNDYRHVSMGYATAAIHARGHLERWRVLEQIAAIGTSQQDRAEAHRCAGAAEALETFVRHMEDLCVEYERRAQSREVAA